MDQMQITQLILGVLLAIVGALSTWLHSRLNQVESKLADHASLLALHKPKRFAYYPEDGQEHNG